MALHNSPEHPLSIAPCGLLIYLWCVTGLAALVAALIAVACPYSWFHDLNMPYGVHALRYTIFYCRTKCKAHFVRPLVLIPKSDAASHSQLALVRNSTSRNLPLVLAKRLSHDRSPRVPVQGINNNNYWAYACTSIIAVPEFRSEKYCAIRLPLPAGFNSLQ